MMYVGNKLVNLVALYVVNTERASITSPLLSQTAETDVNVLNCYKIRNICATVFKTRAVFEVSPRGKKRFSMANR